MLSHRSRLIPTIVLAFGVVSGCSDYQLVRKQNPTCANIVAAISVIESRDRDCLTDDEVRQVLSRFDGGNDRWGNRLSSWAKCQDGEFSYLIVSPGSDGIFEFEHERGYWQLTDRDLYGRPELDIVYRNGQPVSYVLK